MIISAGLSIQQAAFNLNLSLEHPTWTKVAFGPSTSDRYLPFTMWSSRTWDLHQVNKSKDWLYYDSTVVVDVRRDIIRLAIGSKSCCNLGAVNFTTCSWQSYYLNHIVGQFLYLWSVYIFFTLVNYNFKVVLTKNCLFYYCRWHNLPVGRLN